LSDFRIKNHPILRFKRGNKRIFYFDGKPIEGYENESVLAALYATGVRVFSRSKVLKRPRGAFCMIGKCSSCLMEVDGVPNTRTCIIPVKYVKNVRRQECLAMPPAIASFKAGQSLSLNTDVLVVGGGPAGLYAALYASKYGAKVTLIDENPMIGGQLIKQTHKFFGSKDLYSGVRGFEIAKKLIKILSNKRKYRIFSKYHCFRDI